MPIRTSHTRLSIQPTTLFLGIILIVLLCFAGFQIIFSYITQIQQTFPTNAIPGRIIVVLKAANRTNADRILDSYKLNYFENLSAQKGNDYTFEVVVPIHSEPEWLQRFQQDPSVISAQYLMNSNSVSPAQNY